MHPIFVEILAGVAFLTVWFLAGQILVSSRCPQKEVAQSRQMP